MESTVEHPINAVQHGLVQEYCKEAERRIILARSHGDAMTIKKVWCNRFKAECESELLINATSAYLDEVIIRQWKENHT